MPFQNNFEFNLGPNDDGFKYTLNFQPVIPVSLSLAKHDVQDAHVLLGRNIMQRAVRFIVTPLFPTGNEAGTHDRDVRQMNYIAFRNRTDKEQL